MDDELLKYLELNRTKWRYMMIKNLKNVLKYLKTIPKYIEKLKIISERQINEIDQKKVRRIRNKKKDRLEEVDENLRISILRNRFLKRPKTLKKK